MAKAPAPAWQPPWSTRDAAIAAFIVVSTAEGIAMSIDGIDSENDLAECHECFSGFLENWLQSQAANSTYPAAFAYLLIHRNPPPSDPPYAAPHAVVKEFGFGDALAGPPTAVEVPLTRLLQEALRALP